LAADGLIGARVGSGTVVLSRPEASPATDALPWRQLFAADTNLSPAIRDIIRAALRQDVIPLAASEPSPDLFPMEEVRALADSIFERQGAEALRYAAVEGLPALREAIARRLADRGARTTADNVVVTAGAQQALSILARCFVEPGSEVAMETPTYLGAIQAFRAQGARLVPVPVDAEGMRVDSLEQTLARRSVRCVVTIPNFNNPTGAVMSLERRLRLLEVTRRYGVPLIEDDVYGETWLESPPPAPLIAGKPADHVIHVGSLSKALFAGLRVGWIAAAPAVAERVALIKQTTDLFCGTFSQWLAARILEEGVFDRHVARVRPVYRRRRDVLVAAIERYAGRYLSVNRPAGGSFLWCRLADGLRARELLPYAGAAGVTFVPGDLFSVAGNDEGGFRVGFSLPPEEVLEEGAKRLGGAIEALASRRGVVSAAIGAPPLV